MNEDQELKALQEHAAELKETFEQIVAERVNEALETVAETVYHALSEELTEALDDYLNSEVGKAVNELSEAVDGVENLIITLADCGDEKVRAAFVARVASAAQQQPRSDDTANHFTSANQDGSHGIDGDENARRNRASLKPSGGVAYGTQRLGEDVDPRIAGYLEHAEMEAAKKTTPLDETYDPRANQEMRDRLEERAREQKERFHSAMMEHLLNRGLGGTATEPKSKDGNGVLWE